MLKQVLIFIVLVVSLSLNVNNYIQEYLIQKEREFYSEYLDYTVLSDRNGQVMGLMQLQTVAEPVVNDTLIVFTSDKEYYLTVAEVNEFNNLAIEE